MVSWAVGQCILVVWLIPLFPQNPRLTGSFFTQLLQCLIDLILWSMRCLRKSQVYFFVFINCLPQQQGLASRIFPLITQMSHLSRIKDPLLFMAALQHKDTKICVLMGIHSGSGWKLVLLWLLDRAAITWAQPMKSNPRCKYGYLSCFDVDVIKKTESSNE